MNYLDHDEVERVGELSDMVLRINRCATVVKGGRRFSFSALVVVGNRNGVVGFGFGKANEVPPSVEKAIKDAKKHLIRIPRVGTTIPHESEGEYGASKVRIIPAAPGTGIIAGAVARAFLELGGIRDILSKAYGSTSPVNLVKATMDALLRLRSKEDVERLRGVPLTLRTPGQVKKVVAAAAPAATAATGDAAQSQS